MPENFIPELIETVDEWAKTRYGAHYDRESILSALRVLGSSDSRVDPGNRDNLINFAYIIHDSTQALPKHTQANRKKILQAIIFMVEEYHPLQRSPSFSLAEYAATLSCLSDHDFSRLLGRDNHNKCPVLDESLAYTLSCIMQFQEVKKLYLEVKASETTLGPQGVKAILAYAKQHDLEPEIHYPLFARARDLMHIQNNTEQLLKNMGKIAQQRIRESGSREDTTHELYNKIIKIYDTAGFRYLAAPANAEAVIRSLTMDVNLQKLYTTARQLANGEPGWASDRIKGSQDLAVLESIFKCTEDKRLCDFADEAAVKACVNKILLLTKLQRMHFYEIDPICAQFLMTLEPELFTIISSYSNDQIHRIILLNNQEALPNFSELSAAQQQTLLQLKPQQWTAIVSSNDVSDMLSKTSYYIELYTLCFENQPIADAPEKRAQAATTLANTLESHAFFQDYDDSQLNEHVKWFYSLAAEQQQTITALPTEQIAQLRQAHAWSLCFEIGIAPCLSTLNTIQTFSNYRADKWQQHYHYLKSIHRLTADERTKLLHLDPLVQQRLIILPIAMQQQFLKQEPDGIQRLAGRLSARQVSARTEQDTDASLTELLSSTLVESRTERADPHNNHWHKLDAFAKKHIPSVSSQAQRPRLQSGSSRPSRSAWFLLQKHGYEATLHYLDLADEMDKIKCFIQLAKLLNKPTSQLWIPGLARFGFSLNYGGRGALGVQSPAGISEILSTLTSASFPFPRWFPVELSAIEHTSSLITTARYELSRIVTHRLVAQPSNSRGQSTTTSRDPLVQALYDAITSTWPNHRDTSLTSAESRYDFSSGDDDDDDDEYVASGGAANKSSRSAY